MYPPAIMKSTAGPTAPHPALTDYYPTEEQRQGILTNLFDHVAPDYNWISQLLSFGSGNWHRKKTLQIAGLKEGMKVLDVACGPGTVGRCALNLVGPHGCVIGLDPSVGMLQEAKKNSLSRVTQSLAEFLPFRETTFDFVTMGYALRHVSDLQHTFREFFRVLKPGGIMLILEISRPHPGIPFHVAKFFLKTVIPRLAQIKTRNQQAQILMRYYWDTIENCVPPPSILSAIEAAGFLNSRVSDIGGGLIRDYMAFKSFPP